MQKPPVESKAMIINIPHDNIGISLERIILAIGSEKVNINPCWKYQQKQRGIRQCLFDAIVAAEEPEK